MTNLKTLIELLQRKEANAERPYFLPEVWNCFGFKDYTIAPTRPGEISVNPAQYFRAALEWICTQGENSRGTNEQGQGRNEEPPKTGDKLSGRIIYSTLLRTLTAWDHYPGEPLLPGTFLKAIALLPFLKSLGVDIIYLLPIFANGEKYKKGELGSPYAIKNFYQLDPLLHDPLLGEMTPSLLATEFGAFVEGCHLLGCQVMLDFAFRTASRDNDLISGHPEWFYWIDLAANDGFAPPTVKKVKRADGRSQQEVEVLYKAKEIQSYLAKFRPSPSELDPKRWKAFQEEYGHSKENPLTLIEQEFGVTTVPGFSDVIGDPQPPWEDVTYLRYYFDHHPKARKYITPEQPPYLLQDIARLNHYPGEVPNRELWEYITNIIPYYRDKFGIDGARIDMGHALPSALNRAIIEKARAGRPDFILWSEEFNAKNSALAKECGYDFITGDLWLKYKEVGKKGFSRKVFTLLQSSKLPLTGALELPDTPRAAWYHPEKTRLELLVLLNYFLPKVVPLINNGMELMEKQPMNLGLDNTAAGRYVLAEDDPMYGKLAFFDLYRLPWLNEEREFMLTLLRKAATLRRRFLHLLQEENLVKASLRITRKKLVHFAYFTAELGQLLLFIANRDFRNQVRVTGAELLPGELRQSFSAVTLVHTAGGLADQQWILKEKRLLHPGEVLIGFANKFTGGENR